jgi:biotin/methionine sulfoxide reductase
MPGLAHSSHWGAFSVLLRGESIEVIPHPRDSDPSALLGNIPAAVSHPARIARPMVRRGWLEHGPGSDQRRGRDEFVPLSWPCALDLLAEELRRVYAAYGPRAIFGGSYGWASAGRFHDAQSQIHRFLNLAGGYVRSVGSYSSGAATVILPHVIGPQGAVAGNNVSWAELVRESAVVLAFGGMALKNNDVGGGGTSRHIAREQLSAARDRRVEFHLIGPLRDDLPAEIGAVWSATDATTAPSLIGSASGMRRSRIISRAAATASRKTRAGRRQSAASRRKISSPSRGASRVGAPWSPARNPCSAPNTASSRYGWAWC